MISKDFNFIFWYKSIQKKGYDAVLELEDIDELVNTITKWYELKYPEKDFMKVVDIKNSSFITNNLSSRMFLKELLYRLKEEEISLFQGRYRGNGLGIVPICANNGKIREELSFTLNIYFKKDEDSFLTIVVNSLTGRVYKNFELVEYVGEISNYLDGVYHLLEENYGDELDCHELRECLFNHQCDQMLLQRIIHLVAVNLTYSKSTTTQHGKIRAQKMYEEMKRELHLDLLKEIPDSFKEEKLTKEVQDMSYKIEIKRMYELEKFLQGERNIDDFTDDEIAYLNMAKVMPLEEVLKDIEFYKENHLLIDGEIFVRQLMKKYSLDEKNIRKRLIDVMNITKYQESIFKQQCREQKRMIKKLKKISIK